MLPELREKIGFPESSRLTSLDLKFSPTSISDSELEWYQRNGYNQIYSIMGGGYPTWSGESVNIQIALRNSVVWNCNKIISESIGAIPAIVMRDSGGSKMPATKHPMYRAMKLAPNEEISSQVFRETITSHVLLSGNAYAQIIRRSGSGEAIELRLLNPDGVKVDREKTGEKRLVYVITENGNEKTYTVVRGKPHDILHVRGLGWDGLRGYSVVDVYAKNSIGTLIAAEHHVANFWMFGGRVPYNLKLNQKMKEQDLEKFRHDWEKTYSVPNRAPILESWLDYQQTGLNMRDSQALETRQAAIAEICRWFNLSPHLAQDHSRSTFSNIEQLALDFVKFTLTPHMVRLEQDFSRCVLTPEEKDQGYYLKLNANGFLRGDFKTRQEGFASALQNGHMSIDEVRDLEDRNPLPSGIGSHYHIQTNMGTIVRDGQIQPAQPITRLDDAEEVAA